MGQRLHIGTRESDGAPWHHYVPDQPKQAVVLLTGPISGTVQLANGEHVDVTPDAIEVPDLETALEVGHLIGVRHEEDGTHPLHQGADAEPFVHLCTAEACGRHARPASHAGQAEALRRARAQHAAISDPAEADAFAKAHGLTGKRAR